MVKNWEDGVKFLMFSRFVQVFLDSQVEGMLKHKNIYVTPSHTKKIFANMKRQGKDFSGKVMPLFETLMHVTATSNDPLLNGEDRLKLTELMELCTQLQSRVLALETTKANQALEIGSLKRRVKKLEKKVSKKSHKLKISYKIGSLTRVESSDDAGLGDQEDASKQGRMIADLNADEGVALVDETQWRNDQDMFDTSILDDEEVVAEKEVSTADPVPTTGEVVTTAGVEMQAELEEEVRLARQKEEEANIALVESWDNTQAKINTDYELAARLQEEERGELSIEEKSKLFVQLLDARKKHFATLRAKEKRSKPPTKAQKRNQIEKAAEGSSKRAAATPLSSKSPTIVDYKIYKEGSKIFFKIISADGNSQNYLTFGKIFKNFNREDLEVLWSIVKAIFQKTKPADDMDNLLIQTLKIMFEHHVEDNIWKYQQGTPKVLNWKLFNSWEFVVLQHRI
nr:hypothetical protein [Tanacetum cinerariifolium]